jgi:GntR family transcriptional regulator, transcriptional repressor for pyruvate dehydrogenase complex
VKEDRFPTLEQQGALYERIAEHVRGLIEAEKLQPGERLPSERKLAEMLGVSRVPVREAMRILAAQGLVEIRRGQGVHVLSPDLNRTVDELTGVLLKQRDLLLELLAVRQLLEPPSAGWAADRAENGDRQDFERIVNEMEAASKADPPDYTTISERDQ